MIVTEEVKAQNELAGLLQSYIRMLDPGSSQNRFRACLYNRADLDKLPPNERNFMLSHMPVTCDGKPVDLDKWIKATEENPDKNA